MCGANIYLHGCVSLLAPECAPENLLIGRMFEMFDPVIFIAQLSIQKLGVFPLNVFLVSDYCLGAFPESCPAHCSYIRVMVTSDIFLSLLDTILTHFSSVAFHIETSHLFYRPKQCSGFYMKGNTGLK